jgi:hypothetical protein
MINFNKFENNSHVPVKTWEPIFLGCKNFGEKIFFE